MDINLKKTALLKSRIKKYESIIRTLTTQIEKAKKNYSPSLKRLEEQREEFKTSLSTVKAELKNLTPKS